MYVHIHVCVCVFLSMLGEYIHKCEGQRSTAASASISTHLIFETFFSLNLKLMDSARLASQ